MRGRNRTFLLLMGAIAMLLLLGIALLVTVVLLYRTPPGRNLPPRSHETGAHPGRVATAPPAASIRSPMS